MALPGHQDGPPLVANFLYNICMIMKLSSMGNSMILLFISFSFLYTIIVNIKLKLSIQRAKILILTPKYEVGYMSFESINLVLLHHNLSPPQLYHLCSVWPFGSCLSLFILLVESVFYSCIPGHGHAMLFLSKQRQMILFFILVRI